MKTLVIEWQRLLDERKETCPRCGSTELEVEKAVKDLNQMLAPSDVAVNLIKKPIDPETFKKDALQSNKILISGKTLEEWLGATTGQSKCCETCGDTDCRTVEYGGDIHESIPAELIVRAGIAAAAHLFKVQPPHTGPRIPVLKMKFRKK
ncbi:MAG: DUF2703 domain-containing protein [Nitrospirota bacterium]|nr:DUF2703 domain-containing protein [Nitrospirota bacterium]